MHKRTPSTTPPQVQPRSDTGIVRQVRRYKVITPLFGGGANPQQPDEVTVVRASEIRGLLRFWWRATRGGQFGDIATMRKAEEAIWGSAAAKGKPGPSQISILAKVTNRGKTDRPFEVVAKGRKKIVQSRQGSVVPPYAAFPLQPKQEEAKPGMSTKDVWVNVEFLLEIRFLEKHAQEVEAALWAWETFGGIGARTRRGFGALQLISLQKNGQEQSIYRPLSQQVETWLRHNLEKYLAGEQWPESIPHLSPEIALRITPRSGDPLKAWQHLINKLQAFRQKRHKRFGLSLWPEANVIRKRYGIKLKWPDNVPNPRLVEKFPRGQFGLPIIFHMPHDKGSLPEDSFTLLGKPERGSDRSIDRLASPLILRPFVCKDGVVGLAAILEAPRVPPTGLMVPELPAGKRDANTKLEAWEAQSEPLKRVLNGNPDVLQAFLDTL